MRGKLYARILPYYRYCVIHEDSNARFPSTRRYLKYRCFNRLRIDATVTANVSKLYERIYKCMH